MQTVRHTPTTSRSHERTLALDRGSCCGRRCLGRWPGLRRKQTICGFVRVPNSNSRWHHSGADGGSVWADPGFYADNSSSDADAYASNTCNRSCCESRCYDSPCKSDGSDQPTIAGNGYEPDAKSGVHATSSGYRNSTGHVEFSEQHAKHSGVTRYTGCVDCGKYGYVFDSSFWSSLGYTGRRLHTEHGLVAAKYCYGSAGICGRFGSSTDRNDSNRVYLHWNPGRSKSVQRRNNGFSSHQSDCFLDGCDGKQANDCSADQ